ncbi:MAG: hypothetical protein JSU72_20195 [Deltaproteobacteria bacterium]|nr:MAG: hypothetical protein JSU72_20195 [Deltaproteobacteria bacterium]
MKGVCSKRLRVMTMISWGIVTGVMLSWNGVIASEENSRAERIMRIFRVIHRDPKTMEEMIKPFLTPQGLIVSDSRTHSLVVKDRPEVLQKVEELLKHYDQPGRALMVRVEFRGRSRAHETDLAAGGRVRVGDVEIGSGRAPGRRAGASISLGTGHLDTRQNRIFTLRVLEGAPGSIYSGRVITRTVWFLHYVWDHGHLVPGTVFQEARSGFSVTAYLRGADRVELEIVPQLEVLLEQDRRTLAFTEASSRLVTRLGQATVLAEVDERHRALYREVFRGFADEERERALTIVLTPSLIE